MSLESITQRIQEGLTQAQRGKFVADEEMEQFCTQHADNSFDMLWANECLRRATLIDEGSMRLIKADEVMIRYRKSI